jgi:hypothetical protein
MGGPAIFACSTNYLIDVQAAVIVDVEPTTALRNAEVDSTKLMIERAQSALWTETPASYRRYRRTLRFDSTAPTRQCGSGSSRKRP